MSPESGNWLQAPRDLSSKGGVSGIIPTLNHDSHSKKSGYYISPAGQNTFSADTIALLPGGAVDHAEILKLTGISPGLSTQSHRQHRAVFLGAQQQTRSQPGGPQA